MKAHKLAASLENGVSAQLDYGRRILDFELAAGDAADELRRLAEVNAELLDVLNEALSMSASRWLFHNDGLYTRASEIVAKAKEQQ